MGSETMPESDTLSRTLVVACGALARELIELTKGLREGVISQDEYIFEHEAIMVQL